MGQRELEEKVIQSLREGYSEDEIVQAMEDDGYSEERTRRVIAEAEEKMSGGSSEPEPEPSEPDLGSEEPDQAEMPEQAEQPEQTGNEEQAASGAFQKRNPFVVILLSLITFGIYWLYWYYSINSQYKQALDDGSHPGLRTLVLFIPFVNFVALYKTSRSSEEATGGYSWILIFLSFLVFFPLAQYLLQADINEAAD